MKILAGSAPVSRRYLEMRRLDFNGYVVPFDRRQALRRLADESFDVLVVGGGITGAGCALDAATRGLRVALVEAHDFASGTSSKSSKLVHGGLRYLQNGDLGLVYEALAERQILTGNAPHLVHMLPFLLPIFHDGGFIDRRLARGLGLAMWGYDLTGGFRYGKLHDRLSKSDALARFPTLDAPRLAYAYVYYDATADDARLTLAIARTAAFTCRVATTTGQSSLTIETGASSAQRSKLTESRSPCGSLVINACGIWSDRVRRWIGRVTPLIRRKAFTSRCPAR